MPQKFEIGVWTKYYSTKTNEIMPWSACFFPKKESKIFKRLGVEQEMEALVAMLVRKQK